MLENEKVCVVYFRREEMTFLKSRRKRLWASIEGEEAGRMNHPDTFLLCAAQVSRARVRFLAQVVSVGRLSSFAA